MLASAFALHSAGCLQVRTIAAPPMPPIALALEASGHGAAKLCWHQPVHHGGASVLAYDVRYACVASAPAELPLQAICDSILPESWHTMVQVSSPKRYQQMSHIIDRIACESSTAPARGCYASYVSCRFR